jgi:DNA-binding phage protein
MTEDAQVLCDTLRPAIVRAGWSATARRAKVDRVTLHRSFPARRGARVPNLGTVAAVAEALGLTISIAKRADG